MRQDLCYDPAWRAQRHTIQRSQGCPPCLKHHFRRQIFTVNSEGYLRSKNAQAHQHHSSQTPKYTVKRVLLVRSPRCVYAFGKLLAHAEGKKRCLLEGFQKDCSKTLSTFLLPWPSIGSSSGNSFVMSRAGKTAPAPSAPIKQTAPESSCAQETESAQLFRTAREVQITEGFCSLITSHLPNGWSSPIRNDYSHFWAIKATHSLFCSI